MKIEEDVKLDYSDILLVPNRSDISSRFAIKLHKVQCGYTHVPIIAANMDGVGTFEVADVLSQHHMLTALNKHYTAEEIYNYVVNKPNNVKNLIYSMGTNPYDFEKFQTYTRKIREIDDIERLYNGKYQIPFVCIDVANGYSKSFEDFVKTIVKEYPEYKVIAGNVVTPEQTIRLIELGVSIVKIGIGPGSVCTTRKLTGVGYPQLSAVIECSRAADLAGGRIIADGGITCPGDASKAFAAGADYVMIGGMFAGHNEGGGETVDALGSRISSVGDTGQAKFKKFYGMASKTAQTIHNGGLADYRASEGKEVLIPYRGCIENTVKELLGGIRSCATYIGAESLAEFPNKANAIRVNRQLNNVFG